MKQINPYTTRLNEGNAYHMALCSSVVYEDDEKSALAKLKIEDSEYLSYNLVSIDTSQAALIEHDKFLCYAFRGTDEKGDWLTNLNAIGAEEFAGGKFHRGFVGSFSDVWASLNQIYWEKRREKKRPIFITGHSLGGALATICAAYFNYKDWPYMGLYTFGSPRCVEKHTARIFNMECRERAFRFQNSSDIVTRMPSRVLGYSHIGMNLFVDEDGVIQSDPGFWARFVDFFSVEPEDVTDAVLSKITDHPQNEYMKHVDAWRLEL